MWTFLVISISIKSHQYSGSLAFSIIPLLASITSNIQSYGHSVLGSCIQALQTLGKHSNTKPFPQQCGHIFNIGTASRISLPFDSSLTHWAHPEYTVLFSSCEQTCMCRSTQSLVFKCLFFFIYTYPLCDFIQSHSVNVIWMTVIV